MQRFFATFLTGVLFFVGAGTAAAQAVPTHALRLGDTNADVVLLQKTLNLSSDTQVALTGPGSPGMESGYFGLKTLDAVKRFQSKYRNEVLIPAGLAVPTGFVGPLTLTKLSTVGTTQASRVAMVTASATTSHQVPDAKALQKMYATKQDVATLQQLYATQSFSTTSLAVTPITPDMKVPPGVNPNTINLEYALEQKRTFGKQKGLSDEVIAREESEIRAIVATTTDLHKEFFKKFRFASSTSLRTSPAESFVDKAQQALVSVLSVLGLAPKAEAQIVTGSLPFGGFIAFEYPCTCDFGTVWRIFLAPPLPPTYATQLDAVPGNQLFMSHNVPLLGTYLLGFYVPAVPACWLVGETVCDPDPSWGLITPFVGSSLVL